MNTGMRAAEAAQQAGKHILGDGGGGTQGQFSGMVSAERGNLFFGLGKERTSLLRVRQQNLASLGQRDLCSSSVEKLYTKIFFKRLDLKTHGWLREIQLFCGFAKAELLGYCAEDNQTKVIEICHCIYFIPQSV